MQIRQEGRAVIRYADVVMISFWMLQCTSAGEFQTLVLKVKCVTFYIKLKLIKFITKNEFELNLFTIRFELNALQDIVGKINEMQWEQYEGLSVWKRTDLLV